MSPSVADWVTAASTSIQAVIAVIAAGTVWVQYQAHKNEERSALAMSLTQAIEQDDLAAFAVTSLDWGAGCVIIPPSWRDLFHDRTPEYLAEVVEDALSGSLTEETARNIINQLYRHAFVRLFNHLEIVAIHLKSDPELLEELEPIAWIAHKLLRPDYVGKKDLYVNALKSWQYPSGVLRFVCQLDERFPEARRA